MEQTKVASVQEETITDTQGRVLERAGNAIMTVGDIVWTDGVIVYGHTARGFQPFVPEVIPAGTIPLFGSMYNAFVHAVYDETKGEIVRYDAKTPNAFMVNSHNDFSLPNASLGDYDFDADMNDKGDVYVISAGKWSFEYDSYEIKRVTKTCSYGTVTSTITTTERSEARPDGYDRTTSSTSTYEQHYNDGVYTNSNYHYVDIEATPKSGKGETESTAFVWKNGEEIENFTKVFQSAVKETFDNFVQEFPHEWQREKAECEISRVRINENGKTNYLLSVRLVCFTLVPFEIYGTHLTRSIDNGYHRYDPIPSGYYDHGEEIWWVSKEYKWNHVTHGDIESVRTGGGNGYARCNITETYFIDEKGGKTPLTKAKTWTIDGENKKYESGGWRIVGLGDKVFLFCKMEGYSYDQWSSRNSTFDVFRPYQSNSWDTVTRRGRSVDGVVEYNNTYEELADRDKMRFMAQDGFKFDYDGNLYKGNTKIYSYEGDFEWVPKMVTEIEGGYLIGIVDKYTSGRPPIYKLIEINGGKERNVEDTTWMNTRLRHMKNIEKWTQGRSGNNG